MTDITHALSRAAAIILAGAVLASCNGRDEDQTTDAQAAAGQASGDSVWVHEVSDIPVDPEVRYGRLENGLRYAIRVNETPADTAAVRLVFNVGSLAEAEDQRGLAHFIEHMAFNGSTNVAEGEMVPLLERYGLQFGPDTNAFTGFETVGYQLDVPEVDEETIDTALFLMRETASELLLDADAIDRERGVVLSEERFRNTPILRWNNALMRFRYPDTIIPDRMPIGTVEVLENAPRERLVDYYENFYTPERGMLVVVGAVDPDAIEQKIEALFADWRGPDNPRPDPELGSVDTDRPLSTGYFQDPEVFTILTVDAVRPYEETPDTAEARFQNRLASIGNAILGRRFQTIVNSGASPLLQTVVNSTEDFELAERAGVLAVSQPDRWEEALGIVEQELRRALEHGFTEAELNEQLANLRTGLRNAAEQAGTRENSGLADQIWGSWRYDSVFTTPAANLARFEEEADRITVEAVTEAFQAQWDGVEPLLFLATSQDIEDAESAIRDAWEDSRSVEVEAPADGETQAFAYTDFGAPGEVAERTEIADLGVVQMQFENGVRLTFKQTDFEDRRVRVRVGFGRGELEPRAIPAVDIVASSAFIASGLEAHSSDELNRVLAGRSVGRGFTVSDDEFIFGGTTTPTDLDMQMQVFAAYMTAPGWREEGLAQFQASLPELRRNLFSSPLGVVQAEVSRMIRSGDARYGFPDPEEAAGVDVAAMRDFLTPAFENAPIEITIVGDVSEDEAVAAVASTFGALPERAADWPDYDEARDIVFPDPQAEPIVLRHNGPDYQAMVNTYWPTTDDSEPRRSRAFSLLQSVFDIKLTDRLREAEGFTYSAFNDSTQSDVYPDYGYVWVGVDVRIENVERTYEVVDELAAALASGDITEDELTRARNPLLQQIEEAMENNGAWLGWLAQSQSRPERLDRIRSLQGDYESITREELIALAAEYLQPDNSYKVTILPASAE